MDDYINMPASTSRQSCSLSRQLIVEFARSASSVTPPQAMATRTPAGPPTATSALPTRNRRCPGTPPWSPSSSLSSSSSDWEDLQESEDKSDDDIDDNYDDA
ncbi:unnamed protein product [Phytophthora lilii]|uniref:Unnamed protein product n=1 Tax=Phytophthora lilii TaxID=2077276 RepID=A0A9W6TMN6_9STRA|nr:unnamed protein product [Phytophthora lilii]